MNKILQLSNVCFSYDHQEWILQHLNGEINEGEFVAMVGENGAGKSTLPTTVIEVVKIHLRFLKKGKDYGSYLKLVNLEEQGHKMLNELSGGQLQRVAILLALIKNAKLIILDEPTSGVDQLFSEELYRMLERLKKEGKTILMVTHHLQDVQIHVDRILRLVRGQWEEIMYA